MGSRGTAEHYATLPYEALFAGIFVEQESASSYSDMFGAAVKPTSHMVTKVNSERLVALGLKALRRDNMPRALRTAMLLLLLRGDMGWRGEREAGGVLRTSTRPKLNRLLLPYAPV